MSLQPGNVCEKCGQFNHAFTGHRCAAHPANVAFAKFFENKRLEEQREELEERLLELEEAEERVSKAIKNQVTEERMQGFVRAELDKKLKNLRIDAHKA